MLVAVIAHTLTACGWFTARPETLPPVVVNGESYTDEFGPQFELGTPSSADNATDELFMAAHSYRGLRYTSPTDTSYDTLMDAHAELNPNQSLPIASRDTNANVQWTQGWTGKGVKVGVLDGFSDDDHINSHGEYVSLVVNSVAPEAELRTQNTDLSRGDIDSRWAQMDEDGFHIINNSFGVARYSHIDGSEYTTFDEDAAALVESEYKITGPGDYDENIIFIFAAGNSGDYCPDKRLHACNFYGAVFYGQQQNGLEQEDAIIYVGSIGDDSDELESYSLSAGPMKDHFMVAHDDVLAKGDAAGTSFAAPRVAGAAALIRHKFPLLNGFELKRLLLETATDIGDPGVDDVFGYGKLDLENALSPQGDLTAE